MSSFKKESHPERQKALTYDVLSQRMSFRTTKAPVAWKFVGLIVNRTVKGRQVPDTTYLTTEELAARIKYDVRTIRERLKDSVLLEGTHYLRPFGGRKILFVWDAIERDMRAMAGIDRAAIPMANGGVLHG